jgi:nucleoside-diphosphate-sugar epimerase
MNCLVIGGTGFLGQALVADLLKAGHSVSVLHRRAKHNLGRQVKNIMADRNDAHAVRSALAGLKFDLVFDHVYDWDR